jgi:Ran GTPase-activating protein (RanGAP) involved in mRNA processing and transport
MNMVLNHFILEMLKSNDSLKKLYIRENGFGCEGTILIAEGLKSNKTLESLDLGANGIKSEGIVALAGALNDRYNKNDSQFVQIIYTNGCFVAI